jgi:hypothetical protein
MKTLAARGVFTAAICAALATTAGATTLLQMNLEQLTDRAGRIFRGTVLSVQRGSVEVGGATLATITYRIRVEEAFKGEFPAVKDDLRVVEIRMLTEPKSSSTGSVRRVSLLRDLPQLEVGRNYLLFATRPSAVGLSTTVGLGQGTFNIQGAGKDETAVNQFQNMDLFRGMASTTAARGPISYADLASRIRALVRR